MVSQNASTVSSVDLLVKYLEAEGVEYIFGIPGGPLMPLYEAIFASGKIKPILAKHEGGAAFMADGYARVGRGLGVCCATSGPGATNLVTGVAAAYADSIPMLVLTAQVATGAFAKGAAQDGTVHCVDVVEMFKPMTKMSTMLVSGDKMGDMVRLAIRTAMTGRRGPVHLNLPADLVKKQVPFTLVPPERFRPAPAAFDRDAIREASKHLLRAKRPGILIGHGANLSGANAEIKALAERFMIPVATSPKAKGAFPEDHVLSMGVLGFAGSPRADDYFLSGEMDVLLVVGCSLGELSTHAWDPRLQPSSALIQVDIDPEQVGKNYPTSVGIVGDAKACLHELLFQMDRDRKWLEKPSSRTLEWVRSFKSDRPWCLAPEKSLSDASPIKPQRMIHELRQWLPDDAVMFVDIGNSMAWAIHYFPVSEPNTFHLNLGMGSMGHAVAGAIGGKLAARGRTVVALIGDAAFAMNGMEIHTAVDHRVPVVWIVANNGGHGMVAHGERHQFGGKFVSSKFRQPLHVARIAEGMGARVSRVEKAGDLPKALKSALASGEPAVLDVVIDAEEAPPMRMRIEALARFFAGEVSAPAAAAHG